MAQVICSAVPLLQPHRPRWAMTVLTNHLRVTRVPAQAGQIYAGLVDSEPNAGDCRSYPVLPIGADLIRGQIAVKGGRRPSRSDGAAGAALEGDRSRLHDGATEDGASLAGCGRQALRRLEIDGAAIATALLFGPGLLEAHRIPQGQRRAGLPRLSGGADAGPAAPLLTTQQCESGKWS